MKKILVIFSWVTLLTCASALGGSTAIPSDLTKMLKTFDHARAYKDLKTLDRLSHFPLENTVYGEKPLKSKSEFEANLNDSLPGFCYGSDNAQLQPEGKEWILDCDGNDFHFGKVGGQWKYLGYESINE